MGYSISRKDWCRFLVENISPVRWKESAWDSLILNQGQKLILRGLVTSHQYSDNARNQSEQKGKGLVILLHGSPGSGRSKPENRLEMGPTKTNHLKGKTLSAETAAEGTHKALVSTSLGELNRENM